MLASALGRARCALSASCRGLSTASGSSSSAPRAVPLGVPKKPRGGFLGWIEQRRHGVIHVCLSGITVMLSLQLVNAAHKAEDTEVELRGLLKEEARVRKALLKRAPALACDAGLPAAKRERFEKSLYALEEAIIDEDPTSAKAASTAAPSGSASAESTSPATRKVAVW